MAKNLLNLDLSSLFSFSITLNHRCVIIFRINVKLNFFLMLVLLILFAIGILDFGLAKNVAVKF